MKLDVSHIYAIFCAVVFLVFGIIGGIASGYWPFAFLMMSGAPAIILFVWWLDPPQVRKP